MQILAPKSYEPNGDPSSEMEMKTFTLRFGDSTSEFLPVKIDGIPFPENIVMHPTEHGDFSIGLASKGASGFVRTKTDRSAHWLSGRSAVASKRAPWPYPD